MARPKYRHVISLGHFCGTALELQRYGLRDGSYPLDWNISFIRPTLQVIASEFATFLQPESLHRDPVNPEIVHDIGSGIEIYNDFDPALSVHEQYETVRGKYARRITRFQQATRERTLFVRYVTDEEEFAYLDASMPAVLAVLRQANPQNDLLLVANDVLPARCGGLNVYRVPADDRDVVARRFVSKNPLLRRTLLTLHYPLGLRLWNLGVYELRVFRKRAALRTRFRRLRASVNRLYGFRRR